MSRLPWTVDRLLTESKNPKKICEKTLSNFDEYLVVHECWSKVQQLFQFQENSLFRLPYQYLILKKCLENIIWKKSSDSWLFMKTTWYLMYLGEHHTWPIRECQMIRWSQKKMAASTCSTVMIGVKWAWFLCSNSQYSLHNTLVW